MSEYKGEQHIVVKGKVIRFIIRLMYPTEHPPLLKNKAFLAFLFLGLACAGAWIVMTVYFFSTADQCLNDQYCWDDGSNYHTCIVGRTVYCCGSIGSYSCGAYSSCMLKGDYFLDCTGRWASLWVVGMACLSFLVGLMVVAWGHRRRQRQQPLLQGTI